MVKKAGLRSLYYDIMYVLGEHALELADSLPNKIETEYDIELTWKQRFLYKMYQFCIFRGLPEPDIYYTSIHSISDCRKSVKFHEENELD